MKRNTLTSYNHKADYAMEHPFGDSCTVVGEASTIREIYQKFAQGLSLGTTKEQHFIEGMTFDDPDLSKTHQLDPVDRQALVDEQKDQTQNIKNHLTHKQQIKLQKEEERNRAQRAILDGEAGAVASKDKQLKQSTTNKRSDGGEEL